MRRLAWLTLLASARAAPDTDTQLKRAAALARWVDRKGPAPPSWTVAGPKDVTVGQEVHAGKIKKVFRATVELGGSSAVVKTIEQNEGGGTLLSGVDPPRVGRGSGRPAVICRVAGSDRPARRWRNCELTTGNSLLALASVKTLATRGCAAAGDELAVL